MSLCGRVLLRPLRVLQPRVAVTARANASPAAACLPRSVLSHLCYSFFLRKNVVVYSNSVHRLPALYSLLERIAGTTEGAVSVVTVRET